MNMYVSNLRRLSRVRTNPGKS